MAQKCLGRGRERGYTYHSTVQVEPKGMSITSVVTLVLSSRSFWTTREMRAGAP